MSRLGLAWAEFPYTKQLDRPELAIHLKPPANANLRAPSSYEGLVGGAGRCYGHGRTDSDSDVTTEPSKRIASIVEEPIQQALEEVVEQEGRRKAVKFIIEADRLKRVERRVSLMDGSRLENSAEHSWHVALAALVLEDCAPPGMDLSRVLRMLLVHDLVEIDAGDTFLYDPLARRSKRAREQNAANRIFGLLPDESREELKKTWQEYDQAKSSEAKFAKSVDALLPIVLNYFNDGGTWRTPGVTPGLVYAMKKHIADASPALWDIGLAMIRSGVAAGYFRDSGVLDIPLPLERSAHMNLTTVAIKELPHSLRKVVGAEHAASIGNGKVQFFSGRDLSALHSGRQDETRAPARFTVSVAPDNVAAQMLLGEFVSPGQDGSARSEKVRRLTELQKLTPFDPLGLTALPSTLVVSPGDDAEVARRLGVPTNRLTSIECVRFASGEGVAVWVRDSLLCGPFERCVIVVGAIGSGATVMALMERVIERGVAEFYLFASVISPTSRQVLEEYARTRSIALHLHAGVIAGEVGSVFEFHDGEGRDLLAVKRRRAQTPDSASERTIALFS